MANGTPARDYQHEVPAVRRAVDTLEHLAAADGPKSLAQLSRALGVSPSSESAILATLAESDLVARGEEDGLYRLGPGVYSLASAAACRQPVLAAFEAAAPRLAAELGESVLLLRRDTDALVVVAAREGTQPLRFVPSVGERLEGSVPRDRDVLMLEVSPGAVLLAVPLEGDGAYLAVAGPRERVLGGHGARVWTLLREAAGGQPAKPEQHADWERSSPIGTSELDAFLAQPLVATLSYVSDDGYPASIPLWYDWDGTSFWLLPRPHAEWAEHILSDPRVSLAVSESVPPLRRVLARGRAEVRANLDPRAWQQVQERVARRYAGVRAARHMAALAASPRQVLRLLPERLIAWRGLLRYPGTDDAAPSRGRATA